jgi:hypothetical protein
VTLGARDVEVRSAIAHLRLELAEVERREHGLLRLYVDEDLSLSGLKDESDALAKRKVGLHERLVAAEAAVAALHEQAGTRAAIVRGCEAALRGLDRLDLDGRRALLRLLVDQVVIQGETVEIHGCLPTTAPLGPPARRNRNARRDVRHNSAPPTSETRVGSRRDALAQSSPDPDLTL